MKKLLISFLFCLVPLLACGANAHEIPKHCPSLAAIFAHNNMHLEDWGIVGCCNYYDFQRMLGLDWLRIYNIYAKSKKDAIKQGYYILQHASQHGVLLNDPSADGDRECAYITPEGYHLIWESATTAY